MFRSGAFWALTRLLYIREAGSFRRTAGMSDSTFMGWADSGGVFPQHAGLVIALAWLPLLTPGGEFGIVERDTHFTEFRVDGDLITVA